VDDSLTTSAKPLNKEHFTGRKPRFSGSKRLGTKRNGSAAERPDKHPSGGSYSSEWYGSRYWWR
jgi:hypothetical protein